MHRAVGNHAEEILQAMQRCVKRLVELNLRSEPEAVWIGAVMCAVDDMKKKLPATQIAAVQKQLLKDAGAVKSVVNDLDEMIQENADPDLVAER